MRRKRRMKKKKEVWLNIMKKKREKMDNRKEIEKVNREQRMENRC